MKNIFILLSLFIVNEQCLTASLNEFISLSRMVHRLEEYAPLKTATKWDNVGLLVEPSGNFLVKRILVTNDLTSPVLDEAIAKQVDMIISYHPPITKYPPYTDLKPVSRLTQDTWKQQSLIKCIENRIAVYSPHTTWDSIDGGINDWILSVFNTSRVTSIKNTYDEVTSTGFTKSIKLLTSTRYTGDLEDILLGKNTKIQFNSHDLKLIVIKPIESIDRVNTELEFLANDNGVLSLIDLIKKIYTKDLELAQSIIDTLRVYNLQKPLMKNVGLGRIGFLESNMKISEIIHRMKKLLKQETFRLALANGKTIDDKVGVLAVGAGGGFGLLNNTIGDFVISGELTHHEILHETHRGTSILLTDHSNTERGFIHVFKKQFLELLDKNNEKVDILISEADRDPIEYV